MKQVMIEYGDGMMPIDVPDSATIVSPETHYVDPPEVDPRAATREALDHPLGMDPLYVQAKPGKKAVICFPDRVKGGSHEKAHRKICIPMIVEDLKKGGIRDEDITLVCAVGLHKKNSYEEMLGYLGQEIMDEFWPDRIVNHDAEDPENMIELGVDELGDTVNMNKQVYEADIAVMIGHVQCNPYGGYSGGYKMCVTGITGWRCIASHHVPSTMHRDDFLPVNTEHSYMRKQFDAIGRAMEKGMGKRFFCVDAVLGSRAQVLGVWAGAPDLVQEASWPLAQKRTDVFLENQEPFDIMIFGQPKTFHYGPGMGTNPILILQAIGSQVARHKDVFREQGVVICASLCDGWFNDEWFPSYRKLYEKLQTINDFGQVTKFAEEISADPDDIAAYRAGTAYHPFHALSMVSMGGVALNHTSAIYLPGAKAGGYARGMGMRPTDTFKESLEKAIKMVGKDARILVQQKAFTAVSVHLKRK